MNRSLVPGLAAGIGIWLAGCGAIEPVNGPAVHSGSADFSVYVAMGTSLGSGYSNGGLVERHQRHSYPYLFAHQVGAALFTIPSISDSGIPQLLVLRSYHPLLITRAATLGAPTNLGQPTAYHNLSIPGAVLKDANDASLYGRSPLFNIVLRGAGTVVAEALSLGPTFLSVEYGANEVLGPATSGSDVLNPAVEATPAQFAARYTTIMNTIAAGAPNAKVVLFNVPDVTSIPFFTTFPPFTVNPTSGSPVSLLGPAGPLGAGDLVLLTASDSLAAGTGFPDGGYNYLNPAAPGNGRPLLDSQVLSAAEKTNLEGVIVAYNGIIDSVATGRNAALADLNRLLREVSTTGITYGSVTYTSDFISGGVFGLDGVHPTDLGYAIMANAMIDAVNAKFGASIRHVDLAAVATRGRYSARPVRGEVAGPLIPGLDAVLRDLFGEVSPTLP